MSLDQEKLRQQAVTDSGRLELQEDIAEDRTAVNRERIAAQQATAARRNNAK